MGDAKPAATLLKCVVLGSSNVGKTSLLMQFVHGKFTPARRVTTGADFASKVLHLGDREIEMWRRELLQRIDGPPEEFPVVVVGNKVDVPNKTREHEQAAVVRWCRDLGIGLCLTSAKDGTGVAVAMEAVAMLALENKRRRQAASPSRSGRPPPCS
ncbi:GTPase [Aureococcus anophagefferens]|nr:GTPase [Aureococcus anophagefferens]